MTSKPRLRLDSISKRFHIREPRFRRRLARVAMASWLSEKRKEMWALRDVSVSVEPGQMLGIIGMNGSGKSTLLKIIAGVTSATSGTIETEGSLVGLLELGAGFHPDLTGYQNVYLQGNLVGLSKAEMDEKLETIIEFSGLRDFMDWPVKRYSSGMYARLGFSLALHTGAKIILIDEILAVGDADFQRKGLARVREIHEQGETILVLVTHDTALAEEYCDRALWLDHGRAHMLGPASEVCQAYRREAMPAILTMLGYGTDEKVYQQAMERIDPASPLRLSEISFQDSEGKTVEETPAGAPVILSAKIEAERDLEGLDLTAFLVSENQMTLVEIQSNEIGQTISVPAGQSQLEIRLDPQLLLGGTISVTMLIAESPSRQRYLAGSLRQGRLRILAKPDLDSSQLMTHPHHWVEYPGRK